MPTLSKSEVDRIIENDLTDEFHLLAATPGFVLQPMPLSQVRMKAILKYLKFRQYLWPHPSYVHKVKELAAVNTVESLGKLGRHPQDIRTYRLFRKQVTTAKYANKGVSVGLNTICWQALSEWSSMQDYMQCKVFGWPQAIRKGKDTTRMPCNMGLLLLLLQESIASQHSTQVFLHCRRVKLCFGSKS